MIARLYSLNKQFINLNGKLLALPKLTKAFIMDAFSYGLDRNRAIDTLGTQNNALMGGYLLAASNTVIAITGILTTDTIAPLTSGGNVGTVTVNGTISFSMGLKYGAFEVYRGTTRIGRYCLTERQGLQIINQVTGGLQNGLLGGTTTTVWQKSNAFYCETNHTGYSISGTGWVTSAGAALTVGTIIPADPSNPTKCMAWVSEVQQDLQYVGKARNSVSVVSYVTWCNGDRYWSCLAWGGTVTKHKYVCNIYLTASATGGIIGNSIVATSSRALIIQSGRLYLYYYNKQVSIPISSYINTPITIEAGYNNGVVYIMITNNYTGATDYVKSVYAQGTITITSEIVYIGVVQALTQRFVGYLSDISQYADDVLTHHYVPDQHSASYYDVKNKKTINIIGISTNLWQNIDVVYNFYNQIGYELWTNGTDYRIYPLARDGTRIITPAGYEWQETVTAGNMPSVADSRMSTFKYALANSYAVRQSVPEVFDTTDPCAPKLLTYAELSALSNNDKVFITELNGKITNIKAT